MLRLGPGVFHFQFSSHRFARLDPDRFIQLKDNWYSLSVECVGVQDRKKPGWYMGMSENVGLIFPMK